MRIVLVALLVTGCVSTETVSPPTEKVSPPTEGLLFHYALVHSFGGNLQTLTVYADGLILANTVQGFRSGRLGADELQQLVTEGARAIRGVGSTNACEGVSDGSGEGFRLRTSTEELTASVNQLACGRQSNLKRLVAFRNGLAALRAKATTPYTPPAVLIKTNTGTTVQPGDSFPPWPLPDVAPDPSGKLLRLPGGVVALLPQNQRLNGVYRYMESNFILQWRPVLPEIPEPNF
jgi:hypothetical protein